MGQQLEFPEFPKTTHADRVAQERLIAQELKQNGPVAATRLNEDEPADPVLADEDGFGFG